MDLFNSTSSRDVLEDFRIQNGQRGGQNAPENRQEDMGRNEFMELMIAQLNNQNPLEPQENGDFIAQLAQFSSLEEMQKLTGTVDDAMGHFRSTQALQASAMVGQSVMAENDSLALGPEGEVDGRVSLPQSSSNVQISISNPSGDLVRRIDLGAQQQGDVAFTWDGENSSGELMPPGEYRVTAEGQFPGGSERLKTSVAANVDSVSIDNGNITLNLAGVGEVPIGDVREIK